MTYTATYTEPSTDSLGNPLTDLSYCKVAVITTVAGLGTLTSPAIPASAAAGGGEVSSSISIIWGPVPSQAISLEFKASCFDSLGNESFYSSSVKFAVDPYPLNLE